MASMNRVFLIGNLTRDPETRFTPSNTAVGDLRLAVNRRYKTSDGQDKDEVCFVNVVVWGRQAETCEQYLRKGSPVLVEGRLQYDEWEKDGQKQNRLRVVADRVQFLGAPGKSAPVADSPAEGEPAPKESGRQPSRDDARDQAPAGQAKAGGDDDNLPF